VGAAGRAAGDRELIARFEAAGQGHVFRFLSSLPDAEARALLAQAARIDLAAVARLAAGADVSGEIGAVAPPGDELVRREAAAALRPEAERRGLEELAAGRVAVIVAAGGQGTRMGSAAPKGMWPVGPASGKTLFQWHAEKVLHWARRLTRPVPLVVMVSEPTQRATEDFFRWHAYFGLDATWVRMPCQPSLPPLDARGRMLLDARSHIATAPNGHGGLFRTLADAKLLDLLADHGVRTLSYVQIDNPLIRPIDPVFIGLHAARASELSSKSVAKSAPGERVGVFARVAGRPGIVEYSELTDAQASARAADGSLVFGQGSIAAHCIDVAFAQRVAREGLPLHRASKKVPFVDDGGQRVTPSSPNATKFESFLFDAIPRAARSLVLETSREEEFAPIKQDHGADSPDTARAALLALFRGWHERAGLPVGEGALEVDPSKAPDESAFRRLHGLATA
jgi:UDP-N-acetylglucosamine/UDP-N-acetylgalactosamine diphosphorylase